MKVDKIYCMSSFLQFRYIYDENISFSENIIRKKYDLLKGNYKCNKYEDIDLAIKEILAEKLDEKTGIMLSGGMDSAILAKYMPKGTKAYTLRSMVEGSIDESERAKKYADICELDHVIVDIYWEDYEKYTANLMRHKGAPVHSIEPMIYKACLQAKKDGCTKLMFGESADAVFGGQDGLLSKDWSFDEFVERFSYLDPSKVLNESIKIVDPFIPYYRNGIMDTFRFMNDVYFEESTNNYLNPCSLAEIEFLAPYTQMFMEKPIDLERVRRGESKYLIRELFSEKYGNVEPAIKIPMPRGVAWWLENWEGPSRTEFIQGSIEGLKGDQKWQVYCLEMFLNMIEEG